MEKVIRLSGTEYDHFARNMLRDQDFIKDNQIDTIVDTDGRYHCLLVVGEGRRDGILVNSEGGDYARYSALIPNAEAFLTVGQYPALAELNKKLTDIVDFIAQPNGQRHVFDIQGFESMSGINFEFNDVLLNTLQGMLDERPEIADFEIDNNELIVYYNTDSLEQAAEDLTDPSVTRMDMYAYGYGWDGMIPLGMERALELFDKGYEMFRLYDNDAEGIADSRDEIENFDGMFGVEDPAWVKPEKEPPLQVFILNREKNDKGEAVGEWVTLPVLPGDLCEVFERIGIDRPSEGAFTITAVRVRDDYIRDYISKYDSLDELNMLASYMKDMEGFELEKFQAILTSGVMYVGDSTAALINLLDCDNFDGFELIDANDAETLAKYYDRENNEKPDGVTYEEYGRQCVQDEGGRFTEWGYIKFKYKELTPEYTGVVPEEYKITGMALHALRLSKMERGSKDEKPSVIAQIKAAQKAPRQPRKAAADKTKRKGGPEL